jgi:hypothetical protein
MKFGRNFFTAVLAVVFLSATCVSAFAQTVGQTFHLHVLDEVAHLQPLGKPAADRRLNLAISLPLRNRAELDELIRQIYDPSSTNYHRYLTPEQFAEKFGPTESDYQQVIAFARANGLTVTAQHPNRTVLDVAAPVAIVEKTFHVTLRTYQHPREKRTFFAPDTDPSLDLAVPILHVSGLDDFSLPHPASLLKSAAQITPNGTGSAGGAYAGNDFRAAYVPGTALTGAGQTVALLQFDGYYTNDIAAYESSNGLPNVPLTNVLIDGFNGIPTTGANTGNPEVSLDIEMVVSMAPGVSGIILYEAPNPSPWIDILNRMVTDNLAKQISSSWSGGSPDAASEQAFVQMAAQGQSFFCASGDSDAFTGAINFPTESTNITLVGGTTLTTSGPAGAYVSETAWNWGLHNGSYVGSSGGISVTYPLPTYQQGISMTANQGSTTMRNIPDVALTGDNVYVAYGNGGNGIFGGTSCAAPLWAGFTALINQQAAAASLPPVGFINPAIYEIGRQSTYAADFNDVVTGNNFWPNSPTNFPAVPGYDLCTGWGTPGTNLINALVRPDTFIITPDSGFNVIEAPNGAFNLTSQNFSLTNAGAVPLTWSINNTSTWLNVSSSSGTIAAGAASSLAASLNTVASNFTAGTYTASLWFSNVTSGVVHSRLFTLTVDDPLVVLPTNNFSFIGLAGGPFAPASQSIILTNERGGALNWGIINTSTWFNVSPASGSLSSGAQTNVTLTLTPAVTNLANGIYSATLLVTNTTSQFVQAVTVSLFVGSSVQNGGFETGDFTDWTLNGDASDFNFVDNGSVVTSIAPHSGTYFAALGEDGFVATLSQTLPTIAGQKYLISLWQNNPLAGSSRSPNEFSVAWNGSSLFDKTNMAQINWTNLQFIVKATAASTVLQIGGRDDKYYLGLDDVTVTPGFAPAISTQPAPASLVIFSGSNAVFSASVSGSPSLIYQWRKNGTNISNGGSISGATTSALTFTSATTNNSGNYSFIVTNVFGASTSSVAALTVVLPPAISGSLTNRTIECGSNNVNFAVTASGTPPLSLQWSLDGTPISGATNASLSLTNVHVPSHTVTLIVTNLYASVTNSALLTVQDTTAPIITLNGSNPFFLELGNAFTDPGATASDACAGSLSVSTTGSVNTNSIGTNLLTYKADDGSGNIATVNRSVIVRDTTPPTILRSFTNLVLAAGTNCSALMPDVTGTNFILATDLSGTLTISQNPTNHSTLQIGTNLVIIMVADASGNAAFSTNTIVVQDQTPPVIFSQPQNQTNFIGATANFNVGATACTPLSFQWFFNNAALANATNYALAIVSVSTNNTGNYFVIASASGGSITSAVVTLTVNLIPPAINGVAANPDGSFNLNLTGAPGYTYILQATTNLFPPTNWQPIATNTLGTNGAWQFTDELATNFFQQFYRLKLAQ